MVRVLIQSTCLVIVSNSSNNQLSELPDDLNLPNPNFISLENNKFTSYPSALKHHNKIQEIWLYGNNNNNGKITELPDNLNLPNLKGVFLYNNKFTLYPSALNQHNNLEKIYLQGN